MGLIVRQSGSTCPASQGRLQPASSSHTHQRFDVALSRKNPALVMGPATIVGRGLGMGDNTSALLMCSAVAGEQICGW